MNHFLRSFIISVILSVCAEAKIQIYLGVSAQYNTVHHRINFGEEKYWPEVLLDQYQNALKVWKEEEDHFKYCLYGTPLIIFKMLANNNATDFYRDNQSFNQFFMTLGGYFYRNHNILLSGEIYSGYTSSKITKQLRTNIFKGDAPQALNSEVEESSVRYSPISLGKLIWFIGNIDLIQNLVIERNWSYGTLLRIGSIIKNRIYPFFCAGIEMFNLHLKLEDAEFQSDKLYIKHPEDLPTEMNRTVKWKNDAILPKSSLEDSFVTFDKSKLIWKLMAGFGFEFFINRHISVRPQAIYAYSPDTRFMSDKGTSLKFESKYWKINLGMFYRF